MKTIAGWVRDNIFLLTVILTIGVIAIAVIAFTQFNLFIYGEDIRPDEWGQFGDFIGGVLGTFLALVTIIFIRDTYVHQKEEAQKSEIENRFFKMLEFHRGNANEITLPLLDEVQQELFRGRNAFRRMVDDYEKIRHAVVSNFSKYPPLSNSVTRRAGAETAFLLFFYGFKMYRDSAGQYPTNFDLGVEVKNDIKGYIDNLIITIQQDLPNHHEINYWSNFSGHQNVLSHYLRNLFQAIKYIDGQEILDVNEKYTYMINLRAQLAIYEQAVLFIVAIAEPGQEWDLKYKDKKPQRQLISKYNLIRNAPRFWGKILVPHEFFPLVDFEYLPMSDRKEIAKTRKALGFYCYEEILNS